MLPKNDKGLLMEWVLLLLYGALCGGVAYLFAKMGSPKDPPRHIGIALAAIVFVIVVGLGGFDLWWRDARAYF